MQDLQGMPPPPCKVLTVNPVKNFFGGSPLPKTPDPPLDIPVFTSTGTVIPQHCTWDMDEK